MARSKDKYRKHDPTEEVVIHGKTVKAGSAQYEFTRCKWTWYRFLEELAISPDATNPLENVYQSFWPEVAALLQENGLIGLSQQDYQIKANEYQLYLQEGGKRYNDKTRQVGWKDPETGEFNWKNS